MKQSVVAIRNVFVGVVNQGTNMALAFVLLPFIIHNVGRDAYGIFLLVAGIAELTYFLRGPLSRICTITVAQGKERGDDDKINQTLSASVAFSLIPAVVGCVVLATGGELIYRFFNLAPEFHSDTLIVCAMGGFMILCVLPCNPFGGVVGGYQRFDLMRWFELGFRILRAGLIFSFFYAGVRSVAVVMAAAVIGALGVQICSAVLAYRLRPSLRLSVWQVWVADLFAATGGARPRS